MNIWECLSRCENDDMEGQATDCCVMQEKLGQREISPFCGFCEKTAVLALESAFKVGPMACRCKGALERWLDSVGDCSSSSWPQSGKNGRV